jgi:hypothetical protein
VKTKRMKRTIEITMETTEYIFARKTPQPVLAWCAQCTAQVRLVLQEEAAQRAGVSESELMRWIVEQKLHTVKTVTGSAICAESLEKNSPAKV